MRNVILIICLLSLGVFAEGQQYIHFYQQTTPDTYQLYESDSLYFNADKSILYFYNNGSLISHNVAEIDSISFTKDTGNNVYIEFGDNTVNVINPLESEGVTVTSSGAFVTIESTSARSDINYICSGSTTNGMLKVYSNLQFNVLLDNVSITNPVGPAINIQSGMQATISVLAGTSNYLSDGTTYDDPVVTDGEEEDQKATFFSEGKLLFIGGGSLEVVGNGDDQHGIRADDEIIINEGNITISSSVKDGIHAADGFYMYGGILNITGMGDGIDGDEGVVEIENSNVTINSTSNDVKAIASDSPMIIRNSEIILYVEGDQSKGLKSKQTIFIENSTITGTTSGNAVLEASGSGYDPSYCTLIKSGDALTILDCEISIESSGKGARGISSDADFDFLGGNIEIVSTGNGSTYTNTEGVTDSYHSNCISVDGNVTLEDGTLSLTNTGSAGRGISCDGTVTYGTEFTSPTMTVSTTGSAITIVYGSDYDEPRAIKSDNITINNGNIDIVSSDDALHADVSIIINGGSVGISSGDDAIHSDATIEINGGDINVTKSYEGIEAGSITINAGEIRIVSSDDGINAAVDTGNAYLYFNGGRTVVNAAGDGIDSNGYITMTAGTVIVSGPTSNNNGALDYDATFNISGGMLIAVGSAGMAEMPSSTSTQKSLLIGYSTQYSGTLLNLSTSGGDELFTFKLSKNAETVVFSSPDLSLSESYLFYIGGSHSGGETDGLYTDGIYSPGTLNQSFTLTGTNTTINYNGGGGGPGRP